MASKVPENRNGRILQGRWGNLVSKALDELNVGNYGSVRDIWRDRFVRMKIKTAADSNGVAVCNTWNGTSVGPDDIPVRMSTGKGKASEELWAYRCTPNAGVQYSSADVFWAEIAMGETASPTTVSSNAEGSEAAESTTWTQQDNGTPLDLWMCCRVGYFHAGDKKLYGYYRKLSFDTKGRLFAVGAETRVEVDAAEACS